jgi:hypothetical protein
MHRFAAIALSSSIMLQVSPLAGQAPAGTGAITGTAQNAAGQTMPNYTVQVRNLQTGQLAGSTTSNAAGSFSFAGLNPGNYIVEVVNELGAIVGSSAPIGVAAGATIAVTVSTTAAAIAAAGGAGVGLSTALIVTTIAAAAGVAGVVVAARDDASPSE